MQRFECLQQESKATLLVFLVHVHMHKAYCIAGAGQGGLQPMQVPGSTGQGSPGDMSALWLKLQQHHTQEAATGRQQQGLPQQPPLPQQSLPSPQGSQNLGMLRWGQSAGLPGHAGLGGTQQGMPSGGARNPQPSQAETDFWQQLQGR